MPLSCGLEQLTVIRHGQSMANVLFAEAEPDAGVRELAESGDARVPLSPLGRRQAQATGEWLAALGPDDRPHLVLCSPYSRALQTWEGITSVLREPPPPMLVDERLRDREMGTLELLTPSAVRARAPQEAERRARVGEWFYRPPGGESLADVTVRLRDLLVELRDAAAGRRVLMVAHDAVVAAVRHALAGLGSPAPDLLPVPNASISRWAGGNGRLWLVEYGSTAHHSPVQGLSDGS
ncbi:histidine phosphatase family protein [Streptomyces orinoci]|uniref:Histidine phosphatase family protein n=1 Tax=Streptomyces orinoci TaxID=67339 RepID=A0ABV3K6Q6_STRON|nr:histidine phosphatase family protein [Streptomyces orinoci]